MKLFRCSDCGQIIHFENGGCLNCGGQLGYLTSENRMLTLTPEGSNWREAALEGAGPFPLYRFCKNWEVSACNWLIEVPQDGVPSTEFCRACEHNRTIPDLSLPGHLEAWKKIETAKRRMSYTLLNLGLPMPTANSDHPQPLIFDFLADDPKSDEKVMTGHASGVITISLNEADDALREKLRTDLGEDYRTLLGHFRHEIGHYYWDILIRDGGELESFRALFGDDRADYGEALQRHYEQGPPPNWPEHYVSSYATMHPWEDWAETWAHYMHIVDTLETAAALGISMRPKVDQEGTLSADIDQPKGQTAEELLEDWVPLTIALNTLNRSMGESDLYPFTFAPAAREKFAYVHNLVTRPR